MKKQDYQQPNLQVLTFDSKDVLCASVNSPTSGLFGDCYVEDIMSDDWSAGA